VVLCTHLLIKKTIYLFISLLR